MRQPKTRKPVERRQLWANTNSVITAAPTIDDAEWKARIKSRIGVLELTYPTDLTAIDRAMTQVEKVLERKWGPRPAIYRTPDPPKPVAVSSGPLTAAEAATLARVYQRYTPPSRNSAPTTVHTTGFPGAWVSLADVLNSKPETAPRPSLQQQIADWRASQGTREPTHRKTAMGWVPLQRQPRSVDADDPAAHGELLSNRRG
jgi:hypothetical protein